MWIYIPLECPPAKTRLLKRNVTITNENDGVSGGASKGGWDISTYSYFSFSLVM